jgi:hypothetical protein
MLWGLFRPRTEEERRSDQLERIRSMLRRYGCPVDDVSDERLVWAADRFHRMRWHPAEKPEGAGAAQVIHDLARGIVRQNPMDD